jgi:ABC-type dipeptide/oligopeptide/nickel transport system ATPase component
VELPDVSRRPRCPVTIQDQILTLLGSLRAELGLALLLLTRDLAAVARTCDRVAVIYAGRIVKTGPVASVFAAPRHHYTDGLLRAAAEPARRPASRHRRHPARARGPGGLRLRPAAPKADDMCRAVTPVLSAAGDDGHLAARRHALAGQPEDSHT